MSELADMVRSRSRLISRESRLALRRVLEQRARLFALSVPEFNALSQNDQVSQLVQFDVKIYIRNKNYRYVSFKKKDSILSSFLGCVGDLNEF